MFAIRGLNPDLRRLGLHRFPASIANSAGNSVCRGTFYIICSAVIMIGGIVMTALGFSDVTGSGVAMMGMLMIAVAILMFFGALRMFLFVAKLRKAGTTLQISHEQHGTVASLVIERENERRTLTVVMDTRNLAAECRRSSNDDNKPPDYDEAMSECSPESAGDIILDPVSSVAPPPYGLPTYDQAMAAKDKEISDNTEQETDKHSTSDSKESQHLQESTNSIDTLHEQDVCLSAGYEDMPHVTI